MNCDFVAGPSETVINEVKYTFSENGVYAPNHLPMSDLSNETNPGLCSCGLYIVSHEYHWHDNGICHNRYSCTP